MEKLLLEPVQVPWKLSSSDEIDVFRSDGGGDVELLLIADLINERSKDPEADRYEAVNIVRLRLTFRRVQHFSLSRPRTPYFCLDPEKYALPQIDYGNRGGFFRAWFSRQLCPDPNMFLVQNSDIKPLLHIPEDAMSHWLLTGHDELVNVIAKSFSWTVAEYLQ